MYVSYKNRPNHKHLGGDIPIHSNTAVCDKNNPAMYFINYKMGK